MTTIYQTSVLGAGPEAATFADQNMLVLFGENAPDMLKEFCYFIDVNPVAGDIVPGCTLLINDTAYQITAVGEVAQQNLTNLGHVTLVFNGAIKPHLPGAINIADAVPVPELAPGDVLRITT